ncbi:hypothetical protein NDU88_004346 [Pleurodeles waltl]|uniref:peptidylprolyl isomerase n=1 Tax=Pleurodeles waltl TaxID=8319 RepID=A0AAV7M9T5_PLEWA|nr:hypothetical protein NDU88_004346 [Pleurodeles waltl]
MLPASELVALNCVHWTESPGAQGQSLPMAVAASAMGVKVRPQCYFDIEINREPVGRIIFQLFSDVCQKTCKNFLYLCTGQKGTGKTTGKRLCYKGSTFHRVVKNFMIQGGDFSEGNGKGGESIYGGYFKDENFILKHDRAFLLSMANRGKHTNGSQFFITTRPAPHLDNVHVVFGLVISGFEVIETIENLKTDAASRPYADVRVIDCGLLQTQQPNDERSTCVSACPEAPVSKNITKVMPVPEASILETITKIPSVPEASASKKVTKIPPSHDASISKKISKCPPVLEAAVSDKIAKVPSVNEMSGSEKMKVPAVSEAPALKFFTKAPPGQETLLSAKSTNVTYVPEATDSSSKSATSSDTSISDSDLEVEKTRKRKRKRKTKMRAKHEQKRRKEERRNEQPRKEERRKEAVRKEERRKEESKTKRLANQRSHHSVKNSLNEESSKDLNSKREKPVVRPEEIPPVPENKFLLRRAVPVPTSEPEPKPVALTPVDNDQKPSVSKSGRKIKGRGTMRYHTPPRSRSCSESEDDDKSSETPPHWKEEMQRVRAYQPSSGEKWSKGDKLNDGKRREHRSLSQRSSTSDSDNENVRRNHKMKTIKQKKNLTVKTIESSSESILNSQSTVDYNETDQSTAMEFIDSIEGKSSQKKMHKTVHENATNNPHFSTNKNSKCDQTCASNLISNTVDQESALGSDANTKFSEKPNQEEKIPSDKHPDDENTSRPAEANSKVESTPVTEKVESKHLPDDPIPSSGKEEGEASSDSEMEVCDDKRDLNSKPPSPENQKPVISDKNSNGKPVSSDVEKFHSASENRREKSKKHKHRSTKKNLKKARLKKTKEKARLKKEKKEKHQRRKPALIWQPPLEFGEEEEEEVVIEKPISKFVKKDKRQPSENKTTQNFKTSRKTECTQLTGLSLPCKEASDPTSSSNISNSATHHDSGDTLAFVSGKKREVGTEGDSQSDDDMDICTPDHSSPENNAEVSSPAVTAAGPSIINSGQPLPGEYAEKGFLSLTKSENEKENLKVNDKTGKLNNSLPLLIGENNRNQNEHITNSNNLVVDNKWKPVQGPTSMKAAPVPVNMAIVNTNTEQESKPQGVRIEIKSKNRVRPGSLFDEVRKTARLNRRPRNQESSSDESSLNSAALEVDQGVRVTLPGHEVILEVTAEDGTVDIEQGVVVTPQTVIEVVVAVPTAEAAPGVVPTVATEDQEADPTHTTATVGVGAEARGVTADHAVMMDGPDIEDLMPQAEVTAVTRSATAPQMAETSPWILIVFNW